MAFMSGLSLYLITTYFETRQRSKKPVERPLSSRQRANEEVANSSTCCGFFTVRTLCLLGCMCMNAFTKGPMSCFETLGIEFAESRFDMYRAQAGTIVATMGLLGALFLLSMSYLSQRFDDTQLTSGGIFLFVLGIFINTTLDQNEMNASWKYVISTFFCYSIGYPICHTALVGLFSKRELFFHAMGMEYFLFFINTDNRLLFILILFFNSGRKKTTRNFTRLVFSFRIRRKNNISHYCWVHCEK